MSMKNTIIVNKKKIGIVSGIIGQLLVIIALTNSFYVRDYRGILEQYPEFDLFLIENFTNRVELLGRAGEGWALWRYYDDGTAKMYINSTANLHDTFYWQVFEGSTQIKYRELHPINISYSNEKAEVRVTILYFHDSYHTNPVGNLTRVIEAYPYFNKETVIWEPVNKTVKYNLKWNHETKNTIREKLEGTEVTIGAIRISWADSKEKVSSAWRYANGKMYVRYKSVAGIQVIDPTVTVVGVGTDSPTINQGETINLTANVTTCLNCTLSTVLFEVTYPNATKTNFTSYTISQNTLISFWDYNNASANDTFGSNDGTVSGATYNATDGHNGKGAYVFDGSNDYIDMGNDSSLNPSNLTISVWVSKRAIGGDKVIVGKRIGGEPGYVLHYFGNKVNFEVDTDTPLYVAVGDTSDITPDTWIHYVGTYNGTKAILYKNGIAVGNADITGSVSNSAIFYVGRRPAGNYWNGSIDDTRLYNYSMTASQVATLYDQEKNNRFNYSFSDTSQIGTYTIKVFANDTLGGMNSTETTTFSVNDSTNPAVFNLSVNSSTVNQSESIRINVTVTDLTTVDSVWVNITLPNGSVENYQMTSYGYVYEENATSYNGTGEWSELEGAYDGIWGISTQPSCQEINSPCYLFINYTKPNEIYPDETFFPANWQVMFWLPPPYTLNVTVPSNCGNASDTLLLLKVDAVRPNSSWWGFTNWSCWNSSGWQILFTNSSIYGFYVFEEAMWWNFTVHYYLDYSPPLIGSYDVAIWANDTPWGNINNSETTSFSVNDSEPPIVENLSTNISPIDQWDTIEIHADVGEDLNSNISVVLFQITFPNSTVNNYTATNNSKVNFTYSFSDTRHNGTYTYRVFANDTPGGNMNSTESSTFLVSASDYPSISNLAVNSSEILRNQSVKLNCTIIVDSPANVSWAYMEVTYPNNSAKNWSMTNGSNTDKYYGIFRDAKQLGNYTVKIWANSTSELGILWNESADNVTFETHRRNVSASVPSCLGSLVFNATNSNATTKDIVPYNQTNSCGAFNITNTESWNLSSIWMRIDPDINGYEFEVSTSGTFYQPTNLTYVWQALNNSSLNSGSSRMIWIRLDLDWPVLPWNGSFYFGPEDE